MAAVRGRAVGLVLATAACHMGSVGLGRLWGSGQDQVGEGVKGGSQTEGQAVTKGDTTQTKAAHREGRGDGCCAGEQGMHRMGEKRVRPGCKLRASHDQCGDEKCSSHDHVVQRVMVMGVK